MLVPSPRRTGAGNRPLDGAREPRLRPMERKLATALFVDLVDSTALVSSNDPEIARRRVTGFFERVKAHVDAYGGKVEKFAGDAVLAVFGVPTAHEDDAERAVRAAIAIVETGDGELPVRIGIEAGEVVVEDGDSTFATGEAINVAARLQQTADPGEILIGPTAYGLAAGVVTEPLGERALKGFAAGVDVRRVVCTERPTGRPLNVVASYVGREEELELLANAFARAVRDHRAQLVTIFGDPGIGKSRLAREFFAGLERTTVLDGAIAPVRRGARVPPAGGDGAGGGRDLAGRLARGGVRQAPRGLLERRRRRPPRPRIRRARHRLRRPRAVRRSPGPRRSGPQTSPRRSRSCSGSRISTGRRSPSSTSSSISPTGSTTRRC